MLVLAAGAMPIFQVREDGWASKHFGFGGARSLGPKDMQLDGCVLLVVESQSNRSAALLLGSETRHLRC
jgi:hypothetical protein